MRTKLTNISGQLEERLPHAEGNTKSSLGCPGYSTSESFSVTVPCSPLYATWINNRIFYVIVPILLILYLGLAVKVGFSYHQRICRRDGGMWSSKQLALPMPSPG